MQHQVLVLTSKTLVVNKSIDLGQDFLVLGNKKKVSLSRLQDCQLQ